MADVAEVAYEAVSWLSDRADPLTVKLFRSAGSDPAEVAGAPTGRKAGRKAGLGAMPDYAFQGPGVRISEVPADSAAAKAGLLAGDVIVALGAAKIADLRGYADALAAHAPGDAIDVTVQRAGKAVTVRATLTAR